MSLSHIWLLFFTLSLIVWPRGVQTRPWPAGLTNPPDIHLSSARTDTPVGQFRVSAPKTRHQWVEWRVFFFKTRATRPDEGYIQIWQNHAQIRGDLASSQSYLVRFSQIRPFPSYCSDFGADFSDFDVDLVSFYIFRRWFADSGDDVAAPATTPSPPEQTRSPPKPKTDPTDWRWWSVSSHSSVHPTPAGWVWVGLKTDSARPVDTSNGNLVNIVFL